ncbi:MAG: phenylacetate--CoA ligase family protein [Blastocatellia bacterium]
MSDWRLGLYHHLPPPFRSAAASLRGYQLRWWRYGPEIERLVAEALEREQWTPERWQAWREERLARVLHTAATKVPYYREMWAMRRRSGDRAPWEDLRNWPPLEKEALRRHPRAFLSEDADPARMFHDHTSGTTGKAIDLWLPREAVREWYALAEARWRRWYGVSMHDRWGILGGQLITPAARRRPPFWVWNAPMKQLYLSSYHLSPDLIPHYLEAIAKYRLQYLLGYTSSLYTLALRALELRWPRLELKAIITNAEPIYDYQREVIAEAFQCPVRETYGMAETVAAASECEAGALHLWPEAGVLESSPAGELIATGLLNPAMPLIRYQIGDRAALAPAGPACRCGRLLPRLSALEGRNDDVLHTTDGRRIGRLDPVFKSQLPVREAQIIQERLDRLRVRYVPDEKFNAAAIDEIAERLRERMGEIEIVFERMEEIPRGPGGKFRAVICALPPEEFPNK